MAEPATNDYIIAVNCGIGDNRARCMFMRSLFRLNWSELLPSVEIERDLVELEGHPDVGGNPDLKGARSSLISSWATVPTRRAISNINDKIKGGRICDPERRGPDEMLSDSRLPGG